MLLFPFRFVLFELLDILCRGLELRNFVRYRQPRADFIQPGIGIVFKFQQEPKTGKLGMILADKLQVEVRSPAGIRTPKSPGKMKVDAQRKVLRKIDEDKAREEGKKHQARNYFYKMKIPAAAA